MVFVRLDGRDRDDCDPDHVPDQLLTSAQKAYASPLRLTHRVQVWRERWLVWHTCRSRWPKLPQASRDLSSGFHRFYKQSLDSRLVAGLEPGPIALVADLRLVLSLAKLNLDENQVPGGFARQMPRSGIRARPLKRLRQHIDSRGWPIPRRRMVSVPPHISLDVTKRFFMEYLLMLKQINSSRLRWLSECTLFPQLPTNLCR